MFERSEEQMNVVHLKRLINNGYGLIYESYRYS